MKECLVTYVHSGINDREWDELGGG